MTTNDKVVLVDDKWTPGTETLYTSLPVLGNTYCVRAVRPGVNLDVLLMDCHQKPEPSLLLVGIVNPANNNGIERGFAQRRFRKLESGVVGEEMVEGKEMRL